MINFLNSFFPYIPSFDELNRFVITSLHWVSVVGILSILLSIPVGSYFVYRITLRRGNKSKWGRKQPSSKDVAACTMVKKGNEWYLQNAHRVQEVHIINSGLKLYGEYFDFGSDKSVIILLGRTDSLLSAYYFAIPYKTSGYNVLVIDSRAHGESDGKYNTVGFEESLDAIKWAEFLHNEMGVKSVILHGVCIGAAGAVLAITSPKCPDYVSGIVAEGLYANFNEMMRTHLKANKQPPFMYLGMINVWMKLHTNHSMKYGPIDVVGELNKPVLMIHSREDEFSLPEYAEKMYNICPSENKTLVWFDTGTHSKLRYEDEEKYDAAIRLFLTQNFAPRLQNTK